MTAGQRELPAAEIVLREATHIDGVPDGYELVSVSLGIDGVLTCAWAPPKAKDVLQAHDAVPNWASFPVARTSEPVELLITATRDSTTETIAVRGFELGQPTVVRLPRSGDFVAVGARCRLRNGVAEKNAWRISPSGRVLHKGTVGDGVEQLGATGDDDLWASYFDEGIFGNYGWGALSGTRPIGAAGLVRFDSDFTVVWEYPNPKGAYIPAFDSMNVSDQGLMLKLYDDCPIVRVADNETTTWPFFWCSVKIMLVSGSQVGLCGGSPDSRRWFRWNEGTVVDLETGGRRGLRIVGPSGMDWSQRRPHHGACGDALAVVQGRTVYTGRLSP